MNRPGILPSLSLTTKSMALLLIPMLLELVFVFMLISMLRSTAQDFEVLQHSRQAFLAQQRDFVTLQRAVLVILTASTRNVPDQQESVRTVENLLSSKAVDTLITAFPEYQEVQDELNTLRVHVLKPFQKSKALFLNQSVPGTKRFHHFTGQGGATMFFEVDNLEKHMERIETQINAREPERLKQVGIEFAVFLTLGVLLNIGISIFLARLFSIDFVDRLNAIALNLTLIASGRPLKPPQEGTDEIAKLDHVVHASGETLSELRRKEFVITENAADVICSLSRELKFQVVSNASAHQWSYPPDELLGMSLLALVTKDTKQQTRIAFTDILGAGHGTISNVLRSKDGSVKHLLWTVSWSDAGQTYSCVVHDVSEERAIQILRKQFFGMVTHDLRAPLASMNINLSALLAGTFGKLTKNVSTVLESIHSQMSRLMELITELLEVQKLESATPILKKQCLSVYEIIGEACDALRTIVDFSKVEVTPFHDDAAVLGDEQQFTRIVTNMLLYAVSHAEPKSTISFGLAHKDGFVKITLTYSGSVPLLGKDIFSMGELSKDIAPEIATTKDTRFILAIARLLTEAHGGQIGIESGGGKHNIWLTVPEFHEEGEVPDEEL